MSAERNREASTPPLDATARLVYMIRNNDPDAARELDRQFRAPLVRFCIGYLGDPSQAEDAVQETYYRILKASSLPDHFRPWAYQIARNQCLNLLRQRAHRMDNASLPSATRLPDQLTGHLTRLVREERQERLAALVRSLSVEQSEVLRLRYVENLSREEIATVLQLPEAVVKSRLYEGLKTLREYAAELGDT